MNGKTDKYLEELSKAPQLSIEEELALAKIIREGAKGCWEAEEKLIAANKRFVVSVASQYQNQGLTLEELIDEGEQGLICAARQYDEKAAFKFISFAVWFIRKAISEALEKEHNRQPYDEVVKREGMDILQAMKLLAKAALDYNGVSAGYSAMAYYAGWEWLNVFDTTDHPLAHAIRKMPFCEAIPVLFPEYPKELLDEFDVIPTDEEYEEEYIEEMAEELDEETVKALRHGYWLEKQNEP